MAEGVDRMATFAVQLRSDTARRCIFISYARDDGLRVQRYVALLRATWVDREWRTALGLGKRVIPALLDDTALPPELAALQGITV